MKTKTFLDIKLFKVILSLFFLFFFCDFVIDLLMCMVL